MMNSENDYMNPADKVFEGCGMSSREGSVLANRLSDKFAARSTNDKCEVLEPGRSAAVTAAELVAALDKLDTHRDSDDSVNMRNGSTPLDSDSGISSDVGGQVEELQQEVLLRRQTERRLRLALDAAERAHDDALAAVCAERDTLRTHIHLMREENTALAVVRSEYDECSERLHTAESALDEARRELDVLTRRLRSASHTIDNLTAEKVTLQTLLSKSKEECHRINDMYAARQAALIDQNETYSNNFADLTARLQEREELLQQTLKEKELLEMEMSDLLNPTTRDATRHNDQSFEVSLTEQQLLQALDTLHLDSVGNQEYSTDDLDISDTKIERGRPSLFDELLRVDSCHRFIPDGKITDSKETNDDYDSKRKNYESSVNDKEKHNVNNSFNDAKITHNNEDDLNDSAQELTSNCNKNAVQCCGCVHCEDISKFDAAVQTEEDFTFNIQESKSCNAINLDDKTVEIPPCLNCEEKFSHIKELETKIQRLETVLKDTHNELTHYENNLTILQSNFDVVEKKNCQNHRVIEILKNTIDCLEKTIKLNGVNKNVPRNDTRRISGKRTSCVETQTEPPAPACPATLTRYLWSGVRGCLQTAGVVCLLVSLLLLYGVCQYALGRHRCSRGGRVPWSWFSLSDILDLVLHVEYVGEVPM